MDKNRKAEPKTGALHIVGAERAGITKKVASRVGRRIQQAFSVGGKQVHLKGMRFIPSTKVDLGQGAFQVLANMVIEIAGPSGGRGRAESIDSVVTVGREGTTGQVLQTVKIPSLEGMQAEA